MLLSFKENPDVYGEADPLHWFELHVGPMPTGIFFPTPDLYDHMSGKYPPNSYSGMDVEAEASLEIYNQLVDKIEALAFDRPRTRLEITIAIMAISDRMFQKYTNAPPIT